MDADKDLVIGVVIGLVAAAAIAFALRVFGWL